MRSSGESLSPQLAGIRARAQRERKHRFDNLFSLLTPDLLWSSYQRLRRSASPGVDGVSWEAYGEQLRTNILDLHRRLVEQRYRALPARRTYIPKANGKQRPLGIPSLEDKIVQRAVVTILENVYEVDFLPVSYGYRPGVGARDALQDLQAELQFGVYGQVVEADIRGFFDHLDHDWLIRMLEHRLADRKLIRLIRKWLEAGVLDSDGLQINPATGTPQGGIISPLLANIYLHYALDAWFVKVFKRQCRGRCFLMRYADDFVAGFQYVEDSRAFERSLPERLGRFGLEVEPSKTGSHRFSRFAVEDGGSFDFLGFTFRWQRSRAGRPSVARTTSAKSFKRSLGSFTEWIRTARSWPRRMLFAALRRRVAGYWAYYGLRGNSHRLQQIWHQLYLLLFKWLNRSSQRRSYTMRGLTQALRDCGVPGPRIVEPSRPRKPFLWQCA